MERQAAVNFIVSVNMYRRVKAPQSHSLLNVSVPCLFSVSQSERYRVFVCVFTFSLIILLKCVIVHVRLCVSYRSSSTCIVLLCFLVRWEGKICTQFKNTG